MKFFRIAACLSLPVVFFLTGISGAAFAQDFTQGAQAQAHAGWGSGPLMIPLVVAARHEGPLKGVVPTPVVATEPVVVATLALPSKAVAPVRSALAQNEALASARKTAAAHTGREVALATD